MRTSLFILMAAAMGAAAACGGDGGTAPDVAASIEFATGVPDTLFAVHDTVRLAPVVRSAGGQRLEGAPLTFTSSSDVVATVSAEGIVVARSSGTATITARSGGASAQRAIAVRQRLDRVDVVAATPRIAVGATAPLTVTAVDARGNAIAGLPAATFTSSDTTVVRVGGTGAVTAVRNGTAVITARIASPADGARTGTATITVATFVPAATVTMGANTFAPTVIDLQQGGTVTFVNGSGVSHDVDFGVASLNIPVHTAGQTTRTFAGAGTFPFHCNLHAGMSGTVHVAPRQ